jgi:hypothetical protein
LLEYQRQVPKILATAQSVWARRRITQLQQLPPFERAQHITPHGFVHSICTEDEFHQRWRRFHCGMFDGLDWSNVFVAGGAILGIELVKRLSSSNSSTVLMRTTLDLYTACITEIGESNFKGSDIDIFLYGLKSNEEANAKLRHIHYIIMKNTRGRGEVVRTHRAVTILNRYPYRHIQVILRYAIPTPTTLYSNCLTD